MENININCPYCKAPISVHESLISLKCPNCQGEFLTPYGITMMNQQNQNVGQQQPTGNPYNGQGQNQYYQQNQNQYQAPPQGQYQYQNSQGNGKPPKKPKKLWVTIVFAVVASMIGYIVGYCVTGGFNKMFNKDEQASIPYETQAPAPVETQKPVFGGDLIDGLTDNDGNVTELDSELSQLGEFAKGSISGNLYANVWAEVYYKLPDGAYYLDEAGVAEINANLDPELQVIDMCVVDEAAASSMLIMYDLSTPAIMSLEMYLEQFKLGVESVAGEVDFHDGYECYIGDDLYTGMSYYLESDGVDKLVVGRKVDDVVVLIVIDSYSGQLNEDIYTYFY